jgi:hypothetical protein
VLGPAFFQLPAKGGDFIVAAKRAMPVSIGRGRLELLGQLPNAEAELRFDLRKPATMLVEGFVSPFA